MWHLQSSRGGSLCKMVSGMQALLNRWPPLSVPVGTLAPHHTVDRVARGHAYLEPRHPQKAHPR